MLVACFTSYGAVLNGLEAGKRIMLSSAHRALSAMGLEGLHRSIDAICGVILGGRVLF